MTKNQLQLRFKTVMIRKACSLSKYYFDYVFEIDLISIKPRCLTLQTSANISHLSGIGKESEEWH